MPDPHAATCGRYIPVGATAWRPFQDSDAAALPLGSKLPFTIDLTVAPPNWTGDTWDGLPGLPNS